METKRKLDFLGLFQIANDKQNLQEIIGWLEAMFLPISTTNRVHEFLRNYTATRGVLFKIPTDPGTVVRKFLQDLLMNVHFLFRQDHKRNRNVSGLTRTIYER